MGAALITDPDNLSVTEVTVNTAIRTIKLNLGAGLSSNGVTGQCLYSYLKEQWKANNELIRTDFPMVAITPEKFEFVDDWEPADNATRKLLRTAGWRELFANSTIKREYAGIITLGNIDATGKDDVTGDRAYYAFSSDTSKTDFTYYGPVNEAILTFERGGNDYRSNTLTTFIRTQGKTYDQTTTVDIGVAAGSTLDYIVYRFPLSEGTDLNIVDSDATISSNAKYNAANIVYYSTAISSSTLYASDLDGGPYNFNVIIDGDRGDSATNLTSQEIYSYVQYQLRQTGNIDGNEGANTKPGVLQDLLLRFVGSDLKTLNVTNSDDALGAGESGVAIINFNPDNINNLFFQDNTQTERNFPFNSSLTISFNTNLSTDGTVSSGSAFRMFYEYTTSNTISSFDISSASGQSATFTSTGAVDFPGSLLNQNDYIQITGSAFANNNSVWQITNVPSDITFNATLIDDLTAVNESGITDGTLRRNPVNSPQAIVVQDSSGKDIANNNLFGISSLTYVYAYNTNTQGDRNTQVDPAIVLRAIGTDRAQYVQLDNQIIDQVATQSYSLIAGLERNYNNP